MAKWLRRRSVHPYLLDKWMPQLNKALERIEEALESDSFPIKLTLSRHELEVLEMACEEARCLPSIREALEIRKAEDQAAFSIIHDASRGDRIDDRLREAARYKAWVPEEGEGRICKYPDETDWYYHVLTKEEGFCEVGPSVPERKNEVLWSVEADCPLEPKEAIRLLAEKIGVKPENLLKWLRRRRSLLEQWKLEHAEESDFQFVALPDLGDLPGQITD